MWMGEQQQLKKLDKKRNFSIILEKAKKFFTSLPFLQFTMPSGLHSVLERPFSEANGRPFLVKRSPLIVC